MRADNSPPEHIPRLNAPPLAVRGHLLPPLDDRERERDGDLRAGPGPKLGAFTMDEMLWTFRPVDPLTLHDRHGCRLFERQERSFFARPGREIIRAGYHPEDTSTPPATAAIAHPHPQPPPLAMPLPPPPPPAPPQALSAEILEREGASIGGGVGATPARGATRARAWSRRGGGSATPGRRRRRTGPLAADDMDAAEGPGSSAQTAGVIQALVEGHYAEERRNEEAKAQLAAAYAAALQGTASSSVRPTFDGVTAAGAGVHMDSRGAFRPRRVFSSSILCRVGSRVFSAVHLFHLA